MCREGLFLPSGRCISSDLTLAEGRCVLSALSPGSALAPPSHPSFRLGGTADGGERETTGRALKYIAAGCGHISLVSTGKLRAQSSQSSQYCGQKQLPAHLSPPDTNIGNKTSIDLSRVSVPLPHPSGWRVFYLFHEFPFILSRTEPSRAQLTDPDLGSST